MPIRIPAFLSKKKSQAKSPEEVSELIQKYKNWVRNDITQEFIANLEHQIEKKLHDDEKETSWLSRFHFNFKIAHSRGFREALRSVIKQFRYEV